MTVRQRVAGPSDCQRGSPALPSARVPALDGLRGVAIGGVMAWHYLGLPLGWTGVDIFFVLSGFLICRILLAAKTSPGYYRSFYIRRAFRIWPLYLIVIILFEILASYGPPHLTAGRLPLWTYLIMGQAVPAFLYGCPIGEMIGLTWSLCLEEYFYLLFPVAVRKLSRSSLVLGLGITAFLSPAIRFFLANRLNDMASYLWRFDGVAIGALLAIACASPAGIKAVRRHARWVLLTASAWLLLAAWTGGARLSVFSFCVVISAVDLIAAALITLVVTTPQGWAAQVLSIRPLAIAGSLSYGLYLLHYGVWLFLPNPLIALLITSIIAGLTWRLLESPLINLALKITSHEGHRWTSVQEGRADTIQVRVC